MALGPADPARIDRRLHTPDKDWQNLEPEERPGQAVPVLPEGSDNVIFTLNSLTIEGMSAYTEEEVAGFYTSYIGQEIALSTLFDIMATLQQKYLEDGYTITKVFIPNQSIESGAAKLVVVEGYVAEIDIDPAILPAPIIADTKRLILAMHPLNMLELERLILLLNDLPDLNVSAVLAKLTPDAPEAIPSGAVRLRLQKNPEKYSYGEASFDNYGSVFLGPYEVSLTARAPHIGPNYSELTGSTVFTTSANEQKYGYLQYDMPLFGASGTTLSLAASYAVTNPGDELKTLEIEGNSKSLIANISHYLIRQRDESLAISASFEFKIPRQISCSRIFTTIANAS
ncbi:MAG: hypothetical protein LRY62_02115 [Alphaproteobacteria bacterium]|nr:hypothetical protein [Alphaproteobacteria bacterium]